MKGSRHQHHAYLYFFSRRSVKRWNSLKLDEVHARHRRLTRPRTVWRDVDVRPIRWFLMD